MIDSDQSGVIDYSELQKYFGQMGQVDTTQQFNMIDTDKDSKISYSEFKVWLIKNTRE